MRTVRVLESLREAAAFLIDNPVRSVYVSDGHVATLHLPGENLEIRPAPKPSVLLDEVCKVLRERENGRYIPVIRLNRTIPGDVSCPSGTFSADTVSEIEYGEGREARNYGTAWALVVAKMKSAKVDFSTGAILEIDGKRKYPLPPEMFETFSPDNPPAENPT